jgi:hypothetical protein
VGFRRNAVCEGVLLLLAPTGTGWVTLVSSGRHARHRRDVRGARPERGDSFLSPFSSSSFSSYMIAVGARTCRRGHKRGD